MQRWADLTQGLWISDQDQRREVAAVGSAIEFVGQLFGKSRLVNFLG